MSTTAWIDIDPAQQSFSSSLQPEPRRSAPPIMQQPVTLKHEEVIWDDSMMDLEYDDLQPVVKTEPDMEEPAVEVQAVDIGILSRQDVDDVDPSQVRPEAVHLRGVDNLSTEDVRLYASTLYSSSEFFKVEWIDDTSLNLAYVSPDIASSALQAFSSTYIEGLSPGTLRPAKPLIGEKSIEGLKVRIAVMGDKKEKGARDRSRWYLFNPHPNEEYERRYNSIRDKVDGSRDSRRRGDRRYEPYSRRRTSRSKSPPLNYDDPPCNEGVELFPNKVKNGTENGRGKTDSRSRSPRETKRPDGDLFPAKVGGIKRGAAMDSPIIPAPYQPFSFNASPGSVVKIEHTTAELFPEKVSMPLETRISGKSLAERIQEDGGARELFPELVGGGGGGRRRRRKAEDHF
jgi:Nuclear cap-binding protein subunit 3